MVNVVGPQTPEIVGQQPDPNWLSQMAQGRSAASRIAEVLRGPQMQQAMQMMNARMAPVQQQGYATRDPSMLEGIAQFAQNMRGQSMMKDLQEQARVLRGEEQAGTQAELQRQDFIRQQQQDFQRQIAEDARRSNAQQFRGGMEVWTNDDGETVEFAMTGEGPKDSQGNPVDLSGFRPVEKTTAGRFGISNLPAAGQREVAGVYGNIRKAQDIKSIAGDMTQEDADSLNNVFANRSIQAMTPMEFENFVTNNMRNFSPRVKRFLEATASLGAEQRHALFGAALTRAEKGSAERFIVGADGLDLGDGLSRVDTFVDGQKAILGGWDDATGSNLLGHPTVQEYRYHRSDEQKPEIVQKIEKMTPEQKQARIAELRAKAGQSEPQPEEETQSPRNVRELRRRNQARSQAVRAQQTILDEMEESEREAGLVQTRRGLRRRN